MNTYKERKDNKAKIKKDELHKQMLAASIDVAYKMCVADIEMTHDSRYKQPTAAMVVNAADEIATQIVRRIYDKGGE